MSKLLFRFCYWIRRIYLGFRKRFLKWFWQRQVMHGCGSFLSPPNVNGFTRATRNTHLAHNVNFNGMIITGEGKVTIGDNFHSGVDCRMITHIHNFDHGDAIPYDSTYIHRDVVIEDNVWLGDQVIILGGVTIGEGAIIQAGSVVVSDVAKHSIAGGHPAKVFKTRNVEHYERLKSEKKFH